MTCVPERLKFTPTPQPSQCLELDKEITIQCSAKGRESPTIRWTTAGMHVAGSQKSDKDFKHLNYLFQNVTVHLPFSYLKMTKVSTSIVSLGN